MVVLEWGVALSSGNSELLSAMGDPTASINDVDIAVEVTCALLPYVRCMVLPWEMPKAAVSPGWGMLITLVPPFPTAGVVVGGCCGPLQRGLTSLPTVTIPHDGFGAWKTCGTSFTPLPLPALVVLSGPIVNAGCGMLSPKVGGGLGLGVLEPPGADLPEWGEWRSWPQFMKAPAGAPVGEGCRGGVPPDVPVEFPLR